MGFDAAFGAIVVTAKAHAYVWLGSLALLVLSVFFAWLALLTKGAENTGPEIDDVLERRGGWSDDEIETQAVEDLRADLSANEGNLVAKTGRVQVALTLLLLALGIELMGQL